MFPSSTKLKKRSSSSSSSFIPPKRIPKPSEIPKPSKIARRDNTDSDANRDVVDNNSGTGCGRSDNNAGNGSSSSSTIEKMAKILADVDCTLLNPTGPPCLPSDSHKFRSNLQRLFSSSSSSKSGFLDGFSAYIQSPLNLRRVLIPMRYDSLGSARGGDSLIRHLLLIPSIQLDIQDMLLEKLPEYFDMSSSQSADNDVARFILNQFRWLDFLVDPNTFSDKLMQVISICPLHLKKEIIGSLPEIIGDHDNKSVVDYLQGLLLEDSAIIVSVLDAFSNLNFDDQMQDQIITVALSCIRTANADHMPYLLRFLLLSATPSNVRRIISKIREQLKFVGVSSKAQNSKHKGKSVLNNMEASILDALRSTLRFKNILCQEILKELKSLEKVQDHKVIDIWLLMLIYMNGESLQKNVEKIVKKKILEGCLQEAMMDQCIRGNNELVQDFFHSFLSLSEYLLACKEEKAREFGTYLYRCLFEEFRDAYSRQEVLGSLLIHIGSGINFEVSSALDAMVLLASKYSRELIPLSSFINGILDYLEGFNVENLHKVYVAFSHLALCARLVSDSFGSSTANELLMIVRKQLGNPNLNYKKMGLIGTLKIISCLGDAANSTGRPLSSQISDCEEALELLKVSLDSCKNLNSPLIFFYDELVALLNGQTLQPVIVEWIGKHVGEFESMFLYDLEGAQYSSKESFCNLEGELWMNLDGDISPICVNILPLASSSLQSASSLEILPSSFSLLSVMERLGNQGSLGGIDALLGCPMYLPSSKYFTGARWQSLSWNQKQVACLSLYFAANWMRELLNAFSTQISGKNECTSQATKDEILAKLLKRLRNLLFMENVLNNSLKSHSLTFPDLYVHMENFGSSMSRQLSCKGRVEKKSEHKKTHDSHSQESTRKKRKATDLDGDKMLRQPTIEDVLKKAGVMTPREASSTSDEPMCRIPEASDCEHVDTEEQDILDVSAFMTVLEAQRSKFRPLQMDCFSILSLSKKQRPDCIDNVAELPLHLYLVRDLNNKLDYFIPSKQLSGLLSVPPGSIKLTVDEFLTNIKVLFPSLKEQFDDAVCNLKEGAESCEEHWKAQSTSAGNPVTPSLVLSNSALSSYFIKEVLHFLRKILQLVDIHKHEDILVELLRSFQPKMEDCVFEDFHLIPSPGSIEYLYCGAFSFVEAALVIACSSSFLLGSEALLSLESIVTFVRKYLEDVKKVKHMNTELIQEVLSSLRGKLGASAERVLKSNWDNGSLEPSSKGKGEKIQKILQIYLSNSSSTSDLLEELSCSVLNEVSSSKTATGDDDLHDFPTLCSGTFVVWYRVLNEQNVAILNSLVKDIVRLKAKAGDQVEAVGTMIIRLRQCANVLVSLVQLCRTHEKVAVHAMAVKYGGKFVDSFLRVFDFLQAHFQMHNEPIIQLVVHLQKATRTIQTLCSEAKGMKQTIITSNVPATKRSMERFLFRVKALLHSTSSGCSFWMGNLKHKNLTGQVVSSQVYLDHNDVEENSAEVAEQENSAEVAEQENSAGVAEQENPVNIACDNEREVDRVPDREAE